MTVAEFLNSLCGVLGREPDSLSLGDTPRTVDQWDSIGHLSIMVTIDRELGVSVEDEDMRTFTSIGQLVDRLRARNALED